MQGVVSLLEGTFTESVMAIWQEFERELGWQRSAQTLPTPHFSYHVTPSYNLADLQSRLTDFVKNQTSFVARTAGLGIFPGANPVIYLPLVRDIALSQLHAGLYAIAEPYNEPVSAYYHPDQWIPHITIAQGDMDSQMLAAMIRLLGGRNFHWEMIINNITILCILPDGREEHFRYIVGVGSKQK